MSREVRKVPADWKHPMKDKYDYRTGEYIQVYQPMHDRSFKVDMEDWYEGWKAWERGERPEYCDEESAQLPYWEYSGGPPDPAYYFPDWPDEIRTHYQMYQTTGEGTPISPVMDTPESLARWLADNNASAFGGMTATYEQWLHTCQGAWAPSMVIADGEMQSGVEFVANTHQEQESQ